jgi:hypothetical protein
MLRAISAKRKLHEDARNRRLNGFVAHIRRQILSGPPNAQDWERQSYRALRDMNIWSGNLKTETYLEDQDTDGGNIKIIIKNVYLVFSLMSVTGIICRL